MSTLQVATILSNTATTPPVFQDSAGTQIGTLCRAWVNFRGLGTVSIDGAFNVSTVTDVGVGLYRVNFTNALPDINYASVGSASTDAVNKNGFLLPTSYATGKTINYTEVTALTGGTALGTPYDPQSVYLAIFR
jgi:hypothetical protein